MNLNRVLLIGAASALSLPLYAQNFVQNGGFETGDLSHWSTNAPSSAISVTTVNPHSGKYSVLLSADYYIEQDFAPVADSSIHQLSYWIKQNFRTPYFNAFILYYSDGSNNYFLPLGTNNGGWGFVDVTSHLAVGKSLIGFRTYGASPNVNTYYDDFTMSGQAVPEPSGLLLLGVPVLGLLLRARR
jgi:hypothetical protein